MCVCLFGWLVLITLIMLFDRWAMKITSPASTTTNVHTSPVKFGFFLQNEYIGVFFFTTASFHSPLLPFHNFQLFITLSLWVFFFSMSNSDERNKMTDNKYVCISNTRKGIKWPFWFTPVGNKLLLLLYTSFFRYRPNFSNQRPLTEVIWLLLLI